MSRPILTALAAAAVLLTGGCVAVEAPAARRRYTWLRPPSAPRAGSRDRRPVLDFHVVAVELRPVHDWFGRGGT